MSNTEASTAKATSEQTAGSEAPNATKDSGANFRTSQPKEAGETVKGEKSKTNTKGDKTENGKDKTEKSDSRFGIAGKPASRVSFRISTNIKLSFKPYGGLAKKDEFCIKPGGVDGAIKPFTSSSGRKQFKKVGIRVNYSIKQLLSIRDKFKAIPIEIDQIPMVFEEGLGDFESLQNQTIASISERTSPSKLKKSSKLPSAKNKSKSDATSTSNTSTSTGYGDTTQRYEGSNDDASFRAKPRVEPSKIKSKLRKSTSTSPQKNDDKNKKGGGGTDKDNKVENTTTSKPSSDDKPTRKTYKASTNVDRTKDGGTGSSTNKSSQESSPPNKDQSNKPKPSATPLSSGRSKGAWGRSRKTLDPMARLKSKITIRLNKITLDNFATLSDQLIRIFEDEITNTEQLTKLVTLIFKTLSDQLIRIFEDEITNTEQLTKLVTLIFEKTVQEHVYGPLYAKLCVALAAKNKSFDEIVFLNGKKQTNQVDFKNVLVKVCQTEFQKGKREAIITDDMDETDKENEMIKQKKILLGTMKFIGQLYLKELIPSKIMTVCLKHLIGQMQSKPSEDDVEGACTLLQTVGSTLDKDENVNKNELTKYYSKLRNIEKNSNRYSVRIRMIIQNLIDSRKNQWKSRGNIKQEGPKALNRNKPSTTTTATVADDFNDFDVLPFDITRMMMGGGGNDATEAIQGSVVPMAGHAVATKQIKYGRANRYTTNTQYEAPVDIQQEQKQSEARQNKALLPQRKGRSGGRRQLLQTTEEEEMKKPMMNEAIKDQSNKPKPSATNETGAIEIGRRKRRTALSSGSDRPCSNGKSVDEDVLDELTGDYLYVRNSVNEQKFLSTLVTYKVEDRKKFVLKFIQKAIDGGKGERLGGLIPKLLNEYILLSNELDAGFIEFFTGYTFEDNPQLALNTAQLLAPLIVDNEINFTDVLEW
eukprot:CAMPEP_0201594150 /NCGR_PEP_ID=MMETSP0190_2-20130828/191549_1 /ASSEMBLY_ACC=CAM_ASM_000263 /TAXON_ID=37353 /ORGANISM="Rosalina sp." /LENGTH=926 /DNA_ID=CAMNT_0048053643 /DNA_START=115 /DNA_END=2893 /DNA_ORIENTATION=+